MTQRRFWIAIIAITLVCWVDHQLFSEGLAARHLQPVMRQAGHLTILAITTVIGYWGWKKDPHSWAKRLWLFLYIAFILILIVVGMIQTQWQPFGKEFLDTLSNTRMAFCSPLPYLGIYILTILYKE